MDYFAGYYCNPYFYQDWRMFTPCSKYNYIIYASYEVHQQKHYALPLQEVLYQKNMLSGREFLTIALTNSCGFVQNGAVPISKTNYKFKKDKYYQILMHAVKQYLGHKHSTNIDELKLILEVIDIQTSQKSFLIDA